MKTYEGWRLYQFRCVLFCRTVTLISKEETMNTKERVGSKTVVKTLQDEMITYPLTYTDLLQDTSGNLLFRLDDMNLKSR